MDLFVLCLFLLERLVSCYVGFLICAIYHPGKWYTLYPFILLCSIVSFAMSHLSVENCRLYVIFQFYCNVMSVFS